MDPTYIFNNLITEDYNNIIDNIYNDIDNITSYIEKDFYYNHKIIKGTMDSLVSFLRSTTPYDARWLEITRELIIFISKKFTKIQVQINKDLFHIIQVNDDYKIKLLILYIIFYHYDARSARTNKTYTGIDFEFNERRIALCQISFFPRRINKFTWVFNPNSLNTSQTQYLINYMFTSKYIYKIGHGSDSLDIPYLFQELFMHNTTYIYAFITKMLDTRFFCEYYKNTINTGEKKCSIYDALLYFGTIDQKKYDELQHISMTMGPVQDVSWNIYNMSSFNLRYAAYDTIYLQNFYFDILRKAMKTTPELYNSYKYIPLITRFVFLEKWDITELLIRIKAIVDPINNYIVKKKENITLIAIFNNIVIKNLKINNVLNIDNLLDINYFKSALTLLFKIVVYSIISNHFTIYKNKDEKFHEKIQLNDVFDTLKLIHLGKLRSLIKAFYIAAEYKIFNYFNQ